MMRRVPLRSRPKAAPRPDREQRLAERAARAVEYAKTCEIAQSGKFTLSRPVPKPVAHRNAHLLGMARDKPCNVQAPGIPAHDRKTVVSCHSNLGIHGKAGARKADDQYSAWGCMACHSWLDRGSAPRAKKQAVFMAAHLRQVLAWREIALDPSSPPRDRAAALWALGLLNATPIPILE